MTNVDLSKIVVVAKPTKVEYDSKKLGLPPERLNESYGADLGAVIFASHERQLAMRRRLAGLLPNARFVDEPSAEALRGAAMVIALGGDNHFIRVSHCLESEPILGINADKKRSYGGLLGVDDASLDRAIQALSEDNFSIQAWTRIEAGVEGKGAGRATSECFAGEETRFFMSRHILRTPEGEEEEHKSAGLLVATGAGSTGWLGSYDEPFDRAARVVKWQLTEAFPRRHTYRHACGELMPSETLTLRSLNDSRGVLAIDSLKLIPFPYGAVATISLSPTPLRVAWI